MEEIGHIKRLFRYPVRAISGEEVLQVSVTKEGIEGNDLYAFVDETNSSSYSWIKQSQLYELSNFRPMNLKKKNNEWTMEIKDPDGFLYPLTDERLLVYLIGRFSHLFELKKTHNKLPLTLFSEQSLREITKNEEYTLSPIKFRPHIYVAWSKKVQESALENTVLWIGERVKFKVVRVLKTDGTKLQIEPLNTGDLKINDTVSL
jgi:uncharacterized protein YcbX